MIVGYFNLPSMHWNNCTSHDNISTYFLSFVDQVNFHQMVDEPKHIADYVANLKMQETFSHNDHCYITFELQVIRNIEADIEHFNYKEADWDVMRCHLVLIS